MEFIFIFIPGLIFCLGILFIITSAAIGYLLELLGFNTGIRSKQKRPINPVPDWITDPAEAAKHILTSSSRPSSPLEPEADTFNPKIPTGGRNQYQGGYTAYLLSLEWRRKRNIVLTRDKHTCQHPGCNSHENLQVHHTSYEYIYYEELNNYEDLITLCKHHHELKHNVSQRNIT